MRGRVKIVVTSHQGKEAVVALFAEGDFFVEGCLIRQPLLLATAASMTKTTVMALKKRRWFASFTPSLLPSYSQPIC